MQSSNSRLNDTAEGFGYPVRIDSLNTTAAHPGITYFQIVMLQPLSGIFQQTKYLPLRYAHLEIELELADQTDPVASKLEAEAVQGDVFKASNTATLWKIQNCMVKVDLCTLDNALENSYVSHFMGGVKQLT